MVAVLHIPLLRSSEWEAAASAGTTRCHPGNWDQNRKEEEGLSRHLSSSRPTWGRQQSAHPQAI